MTTTDLEALAKRQALLASLPPIEERVALRQQLRVSARDLARLVGASRGWIAKFERGDAVPTADRLAALSKFYEVVRGVEAP